VNRRRDKHGGNAWGCWAAEREGRRRNKKVGGNNKNGSGAYNWITCMDFVLTWNYYGLALR
jgi:hypothetical protein